MNPMFRHFMKGKVDIKMKEKKKDSKEDVKGKEGYPWKYL